MKVCCFLLGIFLFSAGIAAAESAQPLCLASMGHPENGEGEMWRIVDISPSNTHIYRSLVFYYHAIPFELDGDVSDFVVYQDSTAQGRHFSGHDLLSNLSIEMDLTTQGNATMTLYPSRREITAKTHNGVNCGAISF